MAYRITGQPQTSRVRFGLIAAITLFAGAMTAGCSTLHGPKMPPMSEAAQTLPAVVTVRAQSDDQPTGTTPSPDPASRLLEPPSPTQTGKSASKPATPGTSPAGPLDTVFKSLFGVASSSDWTPLSFGTLLTEGWNQPFVFSPASDSGALRQEWINAANGVFYRQWVVDYDFRDHVAPSGTRDIGTATIFAPLSRRLELNIAIPFVDYHPIDKSSVSSPGGGKSATSYRATFGDITITPQVMLSETKNTSIMSVLAIRTPTGPLSGGNGGTSIGPQLQFWQGLPDRWVIRGGAGPTIPLTSTGLHTTFDTNLTIGRYLTLDDVRYFKELSVWVAASNSAAMDHSGPVLDTMTILPGVRFRIAKGTWLLYGVEIPLVAPRNEDFGMYFRLVRRW